MAHVNVQRETKTNVSLRLSLDEALYLFDALRFTRPVEYDRLGGDTVWSGLSDALEEWGAPIDVERGTYAETIGD